MKIELVKVIDQNGIIIYEIREDGILKPTYSSYGALGQSYQTTSLKKAKKLYKEVVRSYSNQEPTTILKSIEL